MPLYNQTRYLLLLSNHKTKAATDNSVAAFVLYYKLYFRSYTYGLCSVASDNPLVAGNKLP